MKAVLAGAEAKPLKLSLVSLLQPRVHCCGCPIQMLQLGATPQEEPTTTARSVIITTIYSRHLTAQVVYRAEAACGTRAYEESDG